MRCFSTIFVLFFAISGIFAQVPAGYYNSAVGKSGEELRTALFNIIKNHSAIEYGDLWTAYTSTDVNANGKVWDIYSDIPGGTAEYYFNFGSDKCGNYSQEGDCYNREHTIPQSWFNDAMPMKTDLFHLYPTDGFVNNKRGHWPYGMVSSPTW
ncbi:MAG: endonuclease, partial [Bacteroidales bacterium]|nr:endonuclease [Bacteroidales bacterium]